MRKRSNMRLVNGVVSAAIACFFLAHGLLGSLVPFVAYTGFPRWIVWVGIGFVAVHVCLSVATSYEQLTDAQFPPSARKKRHLALKWATGGLLAAAVAIHVVCMRATSAFSPVTIALVAIVLAAVLAVHVWVGMKSLLKDIGLSKGLITPLRVATCALAVAFAVAAVASLAV